MSAVNPAIVPSAATADPLKLGVLASGMGSNYVAISEAICRGQLDATVAVVIYNNPGAGVAEKAREFGVPAVLLNHREYASREDVDRDIVTVLNRHGVELVVMAGWMRRVTQELINAFPRRMLNIHPSLLPSFPGLHAVKQALDYGVKFSGCTVHWVELEVDSGPIVHQAVVPVRDDDTEASLQARIQVEEHRIYPEAIALVLTILRSQQG
ncbi:MAG: phosphoribosylglycinamide formyltransferase [Cyanobacteria bacterium P01_A01_bin.3]